MDHHGYYSETVTLKCRVIGCKKEMLKKSYKLHLRTVHPTENCEDLTPFGQSRISDMFRKGKKDRDKDTEISAAVDTVELDNSVNETGDIGTAESRKRHWSGDSGLGEDTSSGSKKPKNILDDSNRVTMKDLDDKLDKILLAVKGDRPVQAKNDDIEEAVDTEDKNLIKSIKYCRSMKVITSSGFSYDTETEILSCSVCEDSSASGEFLYSPEEGLEFEEDEFLPREFMRTVCRHILKSKSHTEAVTKLEEKEKEADRLKSKTYHAGMNLGRACMQSYLLGRPYTDYESNVLLLKMSGAEVGELNHSRMFPAAFRTYVSKVVNRRVKTYLQSPLEQTGHLPPVCISADKGTYKHRSRQFLSVVTIMPGGESFLVVVSCGQPVVTDGSTGRELAKNMKNGFDATGVSSIQIEGAVFDGVYFHCSIEEHLTQLYKLEPGQVLYTWDPLHKTGLVDKALTKNLEWLQDMISICQQIFSTFNWGANYEKFREATALFKLTLSNLVNFSDTRFANSKRKVFKNIHYQFAAIISCLDDQVKAGVQNRSGCEASDTRVREKADKAMELKGKILNLSFLLNLSGLVDIYEQFGVIVQVTQMVTLLPHERLDMYTKAVNRMKNMALAQDHKDCAQFFGADDKNHVSGQSTIQIKRVIRRRSSSEVWKSLISMESEQQDSLFSPGDRKVRTL